MGGTKVFSIFSLCLILFSGLPGILSSASAQQQEKRIALVVGDGAYAKSPLATAANDAGLIAQTLQAAGFDVVGARDLDGDTLRGSFRDFIQKAQASGPGTVAMVYLAGYGMQLAGENYFIPVDSPLSRDVDIPIEGLRISDYVRQLASLPLKASIVVLDAARQQPFIEGGQPIASGLALVEPDPHMLIAFNAAPGTVAPSEQGPYGAYAQSLAEMIRTGGLPLPEVFNRVRLRVNEASKGAQVPWDAAKIDAPFMFFDRAPDAPAQAPPDQAAAARTRPIRDLGVQDAYAAALERDTLQGYEDFLAAYPGDPLARRVRAIVAARREAITWLRTYRPIRRRPTGRICGAIRAGRMLMMPAAASPFSPRRWNRRRRLRSSTTTCRRRRPMKSSMSIGPCCLQRSGFRFCAATAAADVFPAAAAAGFRRLGAADRADRAVHPAAAVLRADPGLRAAAGLCGAAAEQHHLHQHPQYDRHQQRHQPAASRSRRRHPPPQPVLLPRLRPLPNRLACPQRQRADRGRALWRRPMSVRRCRKRLCTRRR